MDSPTLTVVLGATGTIGSELVRQLSGAGVPVRALTRDARKVQPLPLVDWREADLNRPASLDDAFRGASRLFLLSSVTEHFAAEQLAAVQAAKRAGMTYLVKLSALGASAQSNSLVGRLHWQVEEAVRQSGMAWAMLRPHVFMQNLLGSVAATVRLERKVYSATADGKIPFIDTHDIAAVAARILLKPETYANRNYYLTGPEAVGYRDVAYLLTELLGTPVGYQVETLEEARQRLEAEGIPGWLREGYLALIAYQRAGGATATVSPAVAQLLGRPARSIETFLRDHLPAFR
jgi:uncharacterized protein YbjT (DUF2867 family)